MLPRLGAIIATRTELAHISAEFAGDAAQTAKAARDWLTALEGPGLDAYRATPALLHRSFLNFFRDGAALQTGLDDRVRALLLAFAETGEILAAESTETEEAIPARDADKAAELSALVDRLAGREQAPPSGEAARQLVRQYHDRGATWGLFTEPGRNDVPDHDGNDTTSDLGDPEDFRITTHSGDVLSRIDADPDSGTSSSPPPPPTEATTASAGLPAVQSSVRATHEPAPEPAVALPNLLNDAFLLEDPFGDVTGRSWSGRPADGFGPIATAHASAYTVHPDRAEPEFVQRVSAPWGEDAWVVDLRIDAQGRAVGPDGSILRDIDVAKTIAEDPDRPSGMPIVLPVPNLASGARRLLRAINATVQDSSLWAPALDGHLHTVTAPKKGPTTTIGLFDHDPVNRTKPAGSWVRFDPPARHVPDRANDVFTTTDGRAFSRSHVEDMLVGNAKGDVSVLNEADRRRESGLREFRDFTVQRHLVQVEGSLQLLLKEENLALPKSALAVFRAHGLPGFLRLRLNGQNQPVWLNTEEAGRYIGTVPEFAQLPDAVEIWLQLCYGATASDHPEPVHTHVAAPPPVDDPLRTLPLGQHVANASRRAVTATTFKAGLATTEPPALWSKPGGELGRRVRFLPEPAPEELGALAVQAGLHPGPDTDVPPAVRETALRLVRALRLTFGHDIAQAKPDRFRNLLAGIGALETLRAGDPELTSLSVEFRMEMWDHLARHDTPNPDRSHYAAALDRARTALQHKRSLRDVSNALSEVMNEHAARGESLLISARGRFPRPAGAPFETRALWALADAEQLLNSPWADDIGTWGREVMHMPSGVRWQPGDHRAQLRALLAKAFEQRLDAPNRHLLAALHLWQQGFWDTSRGRRTDELAVQWNWSGHDAIEGLDTAELIIETIQPDGTTVRRESRPPWAPAPGSSPSQTPEPPLALLVNRTDTGTLTVTMPGGKTSYAVSYEQLFHLMVTLDPTTRTRRQKRSIAIISPHQDPGGLPRMLADLTGHRVHSYNGPLSTEQDPDTGISRVVMHPRPDGTHAAWDTTVWRHPGHRPEPTPRTTTTATPSALPENTYTADSDSETASEAGDLGTGTGSADDALKEASVPAADEQIPLAELDAAGLTLAPAVRTQAVLMNGSLPVRDLGLSTEDLQALAAHRNRTADSTGPTTPPGSGASGDADPDESDDDTEADFDMDELDDLLDGLDQLRNKGLLGAGSDDESTLDESTSDDEAAGHAPASDPEESDDDTEGVPILRARRGDDFNAIDLDDLRGGLNRLREAGWLAAESDDESTSNDGAAGFATKESGARSVQWDWSDRPAPQGFDAYALVKLGRHADGAVQETTFAAPWAGSERPPVLVLTRTTADGRVQTTLPARPDEAYDPEEQDWVAEGYLLERLAELDPDLAGHPDTPVVFLTSQLAAEGVPQRFADRTGLSVYSYSGDIGTRPNPEGGPDLIVLGPRSDGTPGRLTRSISRPPAPTYRLVAPEGLQGDDRPFVGLHQPELYDARQDGDPEAFPAFVPIRRADQYPAAPMSVSPDGTIAVPGTGREFFTTMENFAASAEQLKLIGSQVTLRAHPDTYLRVTANGVTRDLVRVTPEFSSPPVDVCRDFSKQVLGGGQSHVVLRTPQGNTYLAAIETDGGKEVPGVTHLAEELATAEQGGRVLTADQARHLMHRGLGLLAEDSPAPGREYAAYDRGPFAQGQNAALGINGYAQPRHIGEGFLVQGVPFRNEDGERQTTEIARGFGYHFAGAVAFSSDGGSIVTLENVRNREPARTVVNDTVLRNVEYYTPIIHETSARLRGKVERGELAPDSPELAFFECIRTITRLNSELTAAAGDARPDLEQQLDTVGQEARRLLVAIAGDSLRRNGDDWFFRCYDGRTPDGDMHTRESEAVPNPLTMVLLAGHEDHTMSFEGERPGGLLDEADKERLDRIARTVARVAVWRAREGLPLPLLELSGGSAGDPGAGVATPQQQAYLHLTERLTAHLAAWHAVPSAPRLSATDITLTFGPQGTAGRNAPPLRVNAHMQGAREDLTHYLRLPSVPSAPDGPGHTVIGFGAGSKSLTLRARLETRRTARVIFQELLTAHRAGLPLPEVTITGSGSTSVTARQRAAEVQRLLREKLRACYDAWLADAERAEAEFDFDLLVIRSGSLAGGSTPSADGEGGRRRVVITW
ncbi:lonely Cys domain-containing protein [Streptomyces sp. NPDC056492]